MMPLIAIVKTPLNVLALNELRLATGEPVFTIAIAGSSKLANQQLLNAFERVDLVSDAWLSSKNRSPLTSQALRRAPTASSQAGRPGVGTRRKRSQSRDDPLAG